MPPNNWIDDVLDNCEHVETPRSWLWWSLCCAISAAAGNNYFLVTLKGAVIFKANIYVILLGESGLGKEFPVNLAIELVDKADVTRVIAGRSSIQGIVKEASTARTREKKGPLNDSRCFVANGELSTAIIQDPDSLTLLTDLYDRKYKWSNLLKGDGAEKLKDPYFTCLFGSSPAHFYDSIPQVNIDGGYIGRNFIVFEERRYRDTDMFTGEENVDSFPHHKFVPHLERISSRSGRIEPNDNAKERFNNWRRKWRKEQKPEKTGFINRVPGHVLKVAMCLCLADYDDKLEITEEQIEEAIDRVTDLVYSNQRATEGKGIDPNAAQQKMILDLLLQAPNNELTRRKLLTKGYGQFDGALCDKILDNLVELRWVNRERIVAGKNSDWLFKLSGEPLEQYKSFVDGRNRRKA